MPQDRLLIPTVDIIEGDALGKAGIYFQPGKIIQAAKNLGVGIEKLFRDASIFLHMDATTDISRFKIVKAMYPDTAGNYAGPE